MRATGLARSTIGRGLAELRRKDMPEGRRHRSLNTTMIYAKVNIAQLSASRCHGRGACHERH